MMFLEKQIHQNEIQAKHLDSAKLSHALYDDIIEKLTADIEQLKKT